MLSGSVLRGQASFRTPLSQVLSGSSLLLAEKFLARLLGSELLLGQNKHTVVLDFVLPQLSPPDLPVVSL